MLHRSVGFGVYAYAGTPGVNSFDASHEIHASVSNLRGCVWQVSDHFTPAYLASMASAVASFEAGYPAERLQHDVLSSDEATAGDGVTAYADDAFTDEMAYGHAKAA